jgi:hypothetical protein
MFFWLEIAMRHIPFVSVLLTESEKYTDNTIFLYKWKQTFQNKIAVNFFYKHLVVFVVLPR